MNKPFDLEKAMRNGGRCALRSGPEVLITCTDAPGMWPVVGVFFAERDRKTALADTWPKNGQRYPDTESPHDLVNIPEKRTGWVILWKPRKAQEWNTTGGIYQTEADAREDVSRIFTPEAGEKPEIRIVQLPEWEAD